MNHLDDTYLIDQLRAQISDRMAGISAPEGLADSARRCARRRTAGRAVSAGLPALAAVGALVAVLAGSNAPRRPVSAPPPGPTVTVSGVRAEDTAFVVRRVRARLASAGKGGEVADSAQPPDPRVPGDGGSETWNWTDPRTGIEYQIMDILSARTGQPVWTESGAIVRSGDTVRVHWILINHLKRTYSVSDNSSPAPPDSGASFLSPHSSPADIAHALTAGRVTQTGTTTIDGTRTLVLSVPSQAGLTLYVDARSYRPLRAVWSAIGPSRSHNSPLTVNLLPATPANIARARDVTIPAGYAQITSVHARRH